MMAKMKRADWVAEVTKIKMHIQNAEAAELHRPEPWNIGPAPYDSIKLLQAYLKGLEYAL
jgi:hypothetical protein